MEHNQNPITGQTIFLDTQDRRRCVTLTRVQGGVSFIHTSLHSHFLWQRLSRFVHITCCCVKRAVSVEKWSHRWCVLNEDHTQIDTIQKCVSWGAFSLVVDGYCVRAAGAWSWQFNCSEEIKNAWSFSSTRSYDILVWTGAVLPSPLCKWLLLVTVSLIRSWYWCVLSDHFQTHSQNCEKWHI